MSVFAKVVELGSFTAAARQLEMSVSSISQTVSKLEDELQVKLLNRSTRSIGLTEQVKFTTSAAARCYMKHTQCMNNSHAFNNTPIGTLRDWQFFNDGTKCTRVHDCRYAQRVPGTDGKSGHWHSCTRSYC